MNNRLPTFSSIRRHDRIREVSQTPHEVRRLLTSLQRGSSSLQINSRLTKTP